MGVVNGSGGRWHGRGGLSWAGGRRGRCALNRGPVQPTMAEKVEARQARPDERQFAANPRHHRPLDVAALARRG